MFDKRKLASMGKRIKDKREDKDITQQVLGEMIGIPKSGVSKIENNKQSPTIEQIADIATALGVEIEYILGIDKDADFIRDFIKSFSRITTAKEYAANNGDVHDSQDLIFEIEKEFLVLTGDESLFDLIREIAGAQNLKEKLPKVEYNWKLNVAKQKYKENKTKGDEKSYFLISGEQMTEIIESAVIHQSYVEALFREIGVTTPLEGQALPPLKLNTKNKDEKK